MEKVKRLLKIPQKVNKSEVWMAAKLIENNMDNQEIDCLKISLENDSLIIGINVYGTAYGNIPKTWLKEIK